MTAMLLIPARNHDAATADGYVRYYLDTSLFVSVAILLVLGLVMTTSASISIAEQQHGEAFYFFWRQLIYISGSVGLAIFVLTVPVSAWKKLSPYLFLFGVMLLILVLIVGKEVNGSQRWISIGAFNMQPSEFMKLFTVMFLAGYMVRRGDEVKSSVKGFLKPMILLSIVGILLLLEPDFGAGVVIAMTALGMLFLGGVRLWQFVVLLALMGLALALLAYSSPYRVARLTSFVNPWADPFNSGFQLSQALIAFGRGEWFGVGLGASVQKLSYLPEAHTDFLFAVLAEELGLLWVIFIIGLFSMIVIRAIKIAYRAQQLNNQFAAYLTYGAGLLVGLQAFINIGVNMGLLPTKGLTLPFMSYGGSSILVSCLCAALILRVAHENADPDTLPALPKSSV